MTDHTVIVPTNGESPILSDLIANADGPTVAIWTSPLDCPQWLQEVATVLVDTGEPQNIQRWWNLGIRERPLRSWSSSTMT